MGRVRAAAAAMATMDDGGETWDRANAAREGRDGLGVEIRVVRAVGGPLGSERSSLSLPRCWDGGGCGGVDGRGNGDGRGGCARG